jgi:porphobilinogen synthase
MQFPEYRPRRLRKSENFRRMIRETRLWVDQLIYPMFVVPGEGVKRPISSMPGISQLSVDYLVQECREAQKLGIPAVILFGIPERKDELASEAYARDGIMQRAIQAIKESVSDILVITDVCLCEYTSHGHCGMIKNDDVDNDATLDILAKTAVSHAVAGADMVAPSDMMDGRVQAIRKALDQEGFSEIPIMSYAAKFASAFYGPFREAAESAPQFGDRRSYQMDPANSREAMREISLDIAEGADIVMVKPAMPCLDIIRRVRDEFDLPVAAYQVSGEFAMIRAAAQMGWLDGEKAMMEAITSIRRAGADIIITYAAPDIARVLLSR